MSEIIPNQQNDLFADSAGSYSILAFLPDSLACLDLFSGWEDQRLMEK